MVPSFCPAQGKVQYPSAAAAHAALSLHRGRKSPKAAGEQKRSGAPRVYRCADCGQYHMTHRHAGSQRPARGDWAAASEVIR